MPKRQGRDEFGLNLQFGEDRSAEIQTNFYVVILIETATNGFGLGYLAIRREDNFPRYHRFELQSASGELDFRYSPVVILVEFGKLRCVPDRQRQCRFKTVRALSDREAA